MKAAEPCPGCGLAKARGHAAFVVGVAGVITHTEVCAECFRAGFTFVVERSAARLEPWAAHLRKLAIAYDGTDVAQGLRIAADVLASGRAVPPEDPKRAKALKASPAPAAVVVATPAPSKPNGAPTKPPELTSYQRALLFVLHRFGQVSRAELAFIAGYSPRSGSFSEALGMLRAAGLIAGVRLTEQGAAVAATLDEVPPTWEGLITYWCERVGDYAGGLLQLITTHYPHEIERVELAEVSGRSERSGTFSEEIGHLRKLELVTPRGLRASEALMRAAKLVDKARG